ncbi:unnamed protein product [Lampetra planeri]
MAPGSFIATASHAQRRERRRLGTRRAPLSSAGNSRDASRCRRRRPRLAFLLRSTAPGHLRRQQRGNQQQQQQQRERAVDT